MFAHDMKARAKRLLLPTDFSIQSLGYVIDILEQQDEREIELILVYGQKSSSSISEIFAYSKDDFLNDVQSEDFIKGCEFIRNRFAGQLTEIYCDLMTSTNANYVKNYIKGIRADEIFIPKHFSLHMIDKKSFDVRQYLKAGEYRIVESTGEEEIVEESRNQEQSISSLFFRRRYHAIL